MKLVVAFSLVMIPALAFAQHRTGGESFSGGGGGATSGGSSSSGSSSGGSSSSSTSGGESNSIGGGSGMSLAVHRPPSVVVPSNSGPANTNNGTFTNYSNLSPTAPEFARPRGGLPINMAIPRSSAPAPLGGNITFIVGAYNPWNYAYGGLYAAPFYGDFDPFFFDYGFAPVSTTTPTTPSRPDKGVLHFRVKPYDAEVYIDGGLVGHANEFEGVFHKLKLDAGVHRVELRASGYLPLVVNVRIQAGESITYRGALEKTAP